MKFVFLLLSFLFITVVSSQDVLASGYGEFNDSIDSKSVRSIQKGFKKFIRKNKDYKKLLRQAINDSDKREEVRDIATKYFGDIFNFYTISHTREELLFLIGKISARDRWTTGVEIGVGPGIGYSKYYEVILCTQDPIYRSYLGFSVSAYVGVGFTIAVHINRSQVCVRLGAGVGLSAGFSVDYVEYED